MQQLVFMCTSVSYPSSSLCEGVRCCVSGWHLFQCSCPSWATVTQLSLHDSSCPSTRLLHEETRIYSTVCRHTPAGSMVHTLNQTEERGLKTSVFMTSHIIIDIGCDYQKLYRSHARKSNCHQLTKNKKTATDL